MLKKCKIVMLPTNEKAQIINHTVEPKNFLCRYEVPQKLVKDNEGRHLYIVSDEEIKVGDWVLNPIYNSIYQWIENAKIKFDKVNAKKIIATTDTSLIEESRLMKECFPSIIGQPSDSFIKKFIKEYNNGNIITEVMVEYEFNNEAHMENPGYHNFKLKINPKDNTITIRQVKNIYTREEVIALHKLNCERLTNSYTSYDIDWIEEKL